MRILENSGALEGPYLAPSPPRIPPLSDAQLSPAQREGLRPASYPNTPPLNIFRTLAHAPEARTAFLAWGTYILRNNALPPRQREITLPGRNPGLEPGCDPGPRGS